MKTVRITLIIAAVLLFPLQHQVTIVKARINSNQPFAGRIDGRLVGTNLCVKYWLERDKQPEVATYLVTYPMVLHVFGYIYNVEKI